MATDTGERGIPAAETLKLAELTAYAEQSIVSRILVKNKAGSVTLFAFDQGQSLSEHTVPFDALVQVVDGEGEFIIGGKPHRLGPGQVVLMPGDVPHAVNAPVPFKMLLTMLRAG